MKMSSLRPMFQKFPIFWCVHLLSLCLFLHVLLSTAVDTLSANQSLSGDQTLVSNGEVFELGFFTPSNDSRAHYVGIWYKKVSPRTAVWLANRDAPISDKYSSELKLLDNGNLVLLDESNTEIWSTNSSSTVSTSLQLLDDGNLVLKDGSVSKTPIWQSFDHPTDTFLPGSKLSYNKRTKTDQFLTSWRSSKDPGRGRFELKIDPNHSQYVMRWNGSKEYWASGPWNGNSFSLLPEMGVHYLYDFEFVSNENESYFTYTASNPSTISRLVLDVAGQIRQLTWMENTREWNLFWIQPRNFCQVYAACGAFGTCNRGSSASCDCPAGFEPRSGGDWDLGDFSGGCARKTDLKCGGSGGDVGFIQVSWNLRNSSSDQRVDTATAYLPVTAANADGCRSACSGDCSCTGYTYFSNICWVWKREIVDLMQPSDGGGQDDEDYVKTVYLKIDSSDLPSSLSSKSGSKKLGAGIISGIVIPVALTLSGIGFICYKRRTQTRKERGEGNQTDPVLRVYDNARMASDSSGSQNLRKNDEEHSETPFFDFETIVAATNNFSDSNKLGEGGFGPVYKGRLRDGAEVAVKRLSTHSGQGIHEFKNEVALIAKLQHRNLVRLLGYCTKAAEMILVYEYMHNKSLDRFIFDSVHRGSLDWTRRFDIILGIARGLLYLHQDSRLRIIHRDLKTSNILLDEDMNPKISDFGLAKIVQGRDTEASTKRVVGTYGYMSPEYALDGLFSVKSDVFSFGVVVLEIISGKKNSGFYQSDEAVSLLGHAWNLWKEEKALELMDEVLAESPNTSQVMKCISVGLLCIQGDPGDRPNMSNVVMMLGGDAGASSLPHPKEPAFVARRGIFSSSSSSNVHRLQTGSVNEITITIQEGR